MIGDLVVLKLREKNVVLILDQLEILDKIGVAIALAL
jgi:hypothetical protein